MKQIILRKHSILKFTKCFEKYSIAFLILYLYKKPWFKLTTLCRPIYVIMKDLRIIIILIVIIVIAYNNIRIYYISICHLTLFKLITK